MADNCKFVYVPFSSPSTSSIRVLIFCIATREILAGEELFVSYDI